MRASFRIVIHNIFLKIIPANDGTAAVGSTLYPLDMMKSRSSQKPIKCKRLAPAGGSDQDTSA